MDIKKINSIIESFSSQKVLIVGDIMLDKSIWGEVTRISPEAPVQVLDVEKETFAPGGAANVACNVASLGARAYMAGIAGEDESKNILISKMRALGIDTSAIVTDSSRPTIKKTRIIGRGQQLLRVDYEKKGYVEGKVEDDILDLVFQIMETVDIIVVSDYAKGVITKKLMSELTRKARQMNKPIIIDPKPIHKEFYKNAGLITPNTTEALEMKPGLQDIEEVGKSLLNELEGPVLITRGEKGMSLFETGGEITTIATKAKEVFDVTGAGDSVVAALALAIAAGATLQQAAFIANHAAGIVVGKVGTSTVSPDELKQSLENE